MGRSVSAAWPTDALVRSLAVSGWGDLGYGRKFQGVRSTLRALVDELPRKSGEGLVTAWKLSRVTGLSDKWTRECLKMLEAMGVVSWTRGGIVAGRPQPSYIRIVKKRLVELIHRAKRMEVGVRREHKQKVERRCGELGERTVFAPRSAESRAKLHAELSARNPALTGRGLKPSPLKNESLRDAASCKYSAPQVRLSEPFTGKARNTAQEETERREYALWRTWVEEEQGRKAGEAASSAYKDKLRAREAYVRKQDEVLDKEAEYRVKRLQEQGLTGVELIRAILHGATSIVERG